MDFSFNEEQKSLGETVAALLKDHPALLAPDPEEGKGEGVWEALADLGLFALLVPEQYEGVGLSFVDIALATEALGGGLAPPIVASTLIATDIIARFGTAAQKQDLLPRIARGEIRISTAVLEAGKDYDPALMETSIAQHIVSGSKILVPGAEQATHFLVLAQAGFGPTLIILSCDAAGLSVRRHDDLDRSCGFCELTLNNVQIGHDAQIGQDIAQKAVSRFLDVGATIYAALEMGIAARMLDTAVEYARTRVQFGQLIGAFQAIKHKCADIAVLVEAGRSAAYYALWTIAEDDADRARASSMAKSYCGEVARDACNESIQVHGGMGFTWELGLHRFLRRAKVLEHAFGNHRWHYERVIAETLGAQSHRRTDARDAA